MENYNAEKRHQEICDYIHMDLYLPKNKAYGDSFHKLYSELGIISAVTQITHKYNRLVNLAKIVIQLLQTNLFQTHYLI